MLEIEPMRSRATAAATAGPSTTAHGAACYVYLNRYRLYPGHLHLHIMVNRDPQRCSSGGAGYNQHTYHRYQGHACALGGPLHPLPAAALAASIAIELVISSRPLSNSILENQVARYRWIGDERDSEGARTVTHCIVLRTRTSAGAPRARKLNHHRRLSSSGILQVQLAPMLAPVEPA